VKRVRKMLMRAVVLVTAALSERGVVFRERDRGVGVWDLSMERLAAKGFEDELLVCYFEFISLLIKYIIRIYNKVS
jgi:hypothetical protein